MSEAKHTLRSILWYTAYATLQHAHLAQIVMNYF